MDNREGLHSDYIKELKGEINSLLLVDELHWRQRSRAVWLKVGDKNTIYFHQSASQRKKNQSHKWFVGLVGPMVYRAQSVK